MKCSFWLPYVLLLCLCSSLWGQAPPPLELPEVVIVGREESTIPGGAKQLPQPPAPLRRELLDTLNPLMKHSLARFFPLPDFPSRLPLSPSVDRFVEGLFGQYATVHVTGLSRWTGSRSDLTLLASLHATEGHVRNADSIGLGVTFQARLPTPDNVWFLQRGRANLDAETWWRGYHLFGDSGAPRRTCFGVDFQGALGARLEGLKYATSVGFALFALRHEQRSDVEQHLRVQLQALYPDSTIPAVGIASRLDARFWGEQSQVVVGVLFPAIWGRASWLLRGALGLQLARLYNGTGYALPAAEAELQYRLSPQWRAILAGWSRLDEKGWQELWRANPYVASGTVPVPPHERFALRGSVQWAAGEKWSLEAAFQMRSIARWWSWSRTNAGFALEVPSVTLWEASAEALYRFREGFDAGAELRLGRARSAGKPVAYYVPVRLEVFAQQQWNKRLRSRLGTEIVGSRYVGPQEELPGYGRLWMEVSYEFMPRLQMMLLLDNVLNSDIRYWSGYQERGIFVAATVRWVW